MSEPLSWVKLSEKTRSHHHQVCIYPKELNYSEALHVNVLPEDFGSQKELSPRTDLKEDSPEKQDILLQISAQNGAAYPG